MSFRYRLLDETYSGAIFAVMIYADSDRSADRAVGDYVLDYVFGQQSRILGHEKLARGSLPHSALFDLFGR